MRNIFTEHPGRINETYWEHFKCACLFGSQLLTAGVVCILHAIFPFIFEKTAGDILLKATQRFIDRMPINDKRREVFFERLEKNENSSEL